MGDRADDAKDQKAVKERKEWHMNRKHGFRKR